MKWRKNRLNEIPVQMDDVEIIMNKNFPHLEVFLSNVFCLHCNGNTTICNYTAYLDDIGDLIFDGECARCHYPVTRIIETGGSESSKEAGDHIRWIKRQYKSHDKN